MEWSICAIWTRIGGAEDRRRGIFWWWWREGEVACLRVLMARPFGDFLGCDDVYLFRRSAEVRKGGPCAQHKFKS